MDLKSNTEPLLNEFEVKCEEKYLFDDDEFLIHEHR